MPANSEGGRVLVAYPLVSDVDALTDLFFRSTWYLAPLLSRGAVLQIPVAAELNRPSAQDLPSSFDPAVNRLADEFGGQIELLPIEKLEHANASDCLVWDSRYQPPKDYVTGSVWQVDSTRVQHASSYFLKVSSEGSPRLADANRDLSRQVFDVVPWNRFPEHVYVFGTGPSLQNVSAADFRDGVPIACNSMVNNRPLMESLVPPIIVASDPVFHSGCSRYAGLFRQNLFACMYRYGSYFGTIERDVALYREIFPPDLRSRIVAFEAEHDRAIVPDFENSLHVRSQPNILTLLMLPIASHVASAISIAGCDGRPLEDNEYFWSHDPNSQFPDAMQSVVDTNPGFFELNYDDYYMQHIATLEQYCVALEQTGISIRSITESHIPALASRNAR